MFEKDCLIGSLFCIKHCRHDLHEIFTVEEEHGIIMETNMLEKFHLQYHKYV